MGVGGWCYGILAPAFLYRVSTKTKELEHTLARLSALIFHHNVIVKNCIKLCS